MSILSTMWTSSRRRFALAVTAFSVGLLLLLASNGGTMLRQKFTKRNHTPSFLNRKLQEQAKETNRIGDSCSKDYIVVYQSATGPLPSGIPTYTVEIHNMCLNGCAISDIHVSCGWFSSARLINPNIFKRLTYNDCLVNNGSALPNGDALSFAYANTFPYPLAVSSVNCH